MSMIDLLDAHLDYGKAKAAMVAAPPGSLAWPSDPLRDAVQAQGMRFCYQWKENVETIAEIVAGHPDRFPYYHTPDKKGQLPDARTYSEHHRIMSLLVE